MVRDLHGWFVTPKEAVRIQADLASSLEFRWRERTIRTVAGIDVSVREGISRAAIAVLSFPELELVHAVTAERETTFPYISGLLTFREGPVLLEAWAKLRGQPDLVLFDGQGIAHPRRLGLAAHLGLWLDLPTIGCAKSRLYGVHEEPGQEKGCMAPLVDPKTDEPIGFVLRTRTRVKPVFVSPGHQIDLERASEFVLACCTRFRLPETTRWAHRLSRGEATVPVASPGETDF